jgi:hypothetical protein
MVEALKGNTTRGLGVFMSMAGGKSPHFSVHQDPPGPGLRGVGNGKELIISYCCLCRYIWSTWFHPRPSSREEGLDRKVRSENGLSRIIERSC